MRFGCVPCFFCTFVCFVGVFRIILFIFSFNFFFSVHIFSQCVADIVLVFLGAVLQYFYRREALPISSASEFCVERCFVWFGGFPPWLLPASTSLVKTFWVEKGSIVSFYEPGGVVVDANSWGVLLVVNRGRGWMSCVLCVKFASVYDGCSDPLPVDAHAPETDGWVGLWVGGCCCALWYF